jgi:hypothetical protein
MGIANGIGIAQGWQQLSGGGGPTPPTSRISFGYYNSNSLGSFQAFNVIIDNDPMNNVYTVDPIETGTLLQSQYQLDSGAFQLNYAAEAVYAWQVATTNITSNLSGYDYNPSMAMYIPIGTLLISYDLTKDCYLISEPITGYVPNIITISVCGINFIIDTGGAFPDANDIFFAQQLQSIFGASAVIISSDDGIKTYVEVSNCYTQIKPVAIEFIDPIGVNPPYTAVFSPCTP